MTITSNIHVGLAAWSNHTFVLGEDCSNSGNAYRCITAGTSTSAPTGTSSDVDNGGAAHFKWLSAIDYTSYNAWWTAITTPTTQPVIGQIWNHGVVIATLSTEIMSFNGKTTTSTNNITLRCAPGESFRDTAGALTFNASNGVAIQLPASGTGGVNYVNISNSNFILDGIQFKDPNSASGSTVISISGSGNRIQNCIIDGFSQASGGALIIVTGLTAATGLVLENILFIDRATTGRAFMFNAGNATDTVRIVNCTAISTTNVASGTCFNSTSSTSSTFIIRNCAVFGYPISGGLGGSSGASATVIDHCVSDATAIGFSATDGGSNLFSKTAANQFVSSTTNFKLKAGADCLGAGVVDTTDIPADDDVFRTARGATWDVGAFELVTGSTFSRDVIAPAMFGSTVFRDLGVADPFQDLFALDFGPKSGVDAGHLSIIMRDFGSAGPWQDPFSAAFGPVAGIDASHNATVMRDFATATEFQTSRRRDIIVPAALFQGPRIDLAVSLEINSAAAVVLNASVPIEWPRVIVENSINLSEWRSAPFRDIVVPNDTVAPLVTTQTNPVEWGLSARRDDGSPLEIGVVRLSQPIIPIEWKSSFIRDTAIQIEPNAGSAFNAVAPTEWMSSAVMMTATTSIEFGSGRFQDWVISTELASSPFGDAIIPVDWSQPGQVGASIIVSVEFTNRIFEISSPQIEVNKTAMLDRVVPAEWTGNTAATLDASVPIEWRSAIVADGIPSAEWRAAFTVDAISPIFWMSSLVASSAVSAEYVNIVFGDLFVTPDSASETRTRDAASSIEFVATRTRDIAVPMTLAGSANGVSGDFTAPLDFLGSASFDAPVPINNDTLKSTDLIGRLEFTTMILADPAVVNETTLSTSGETASAPEATYSILTEDTIMPAEWLSATVSMDMAFPLASGIEVVLDYIPPVSWISQFSSDMAALIEWTQDTTVTTADATMPLDFLSITVVDIKAYLELEFGRDTIGSQLEPDEWERERD